MSFMGDGRLRSIIVHLDNYLLCLRTAIEKSKDLLEAIKRKRPHAEVQPDRPLVHKVHRALPLLTDL